MSSADTFSAARTFLTSRPGPTPRMWIHASRTIAESATSAWREKVSGTSGNGMTKNGVESFAAGMNRPR